VSYHHMYGMLLKIANLDSRCRQLRTSVDHFVPHDHIGHRQTCEDTHRRFKYSNSGPLHRADADAHARVVANRG
jgi:hypothetical protein